MIIYRERFHHETGFSVSQFTLVPVPVPVPVSVPVPFPFPDPFPDSRFRISWFSIRPPEVGGGGGPRADVEHLTSTAPSSGI